MMTNTPNSNAILNGSRSTSGAVLSIPGNVFFSIDVNVTAAVALAGSSNPRVTITGTGGSHVDGAELLGVNATGLLASASSNSGRTEVCGYTGENGANIVFAAGASGSSACWINGYYL